MDINEMLNNLKDLEPTDVGTLLVHYVVDNFKKEDRMEAIYTIIRTFGIDFLSHELDDDDRETVRSLTLTLEKRLNK